MALYRNYNFVFAICHPDDEALWIGGVLCELSRFEFIKSYVICLSGNDAQSPRVEEFKAAQNVAGYSQGVILGGALRPAPDPLPDTRATLEQGLRMVGLAPAAIDVLITHADYGDEHLHPHHKQAHAELKSWCSRSNVPFGHFSSIPINGLCHIPILTDLRRHKTLHLMNLSRCESFDAPGDSPVDGEPSERSHPQYYVQWLCDPSAKLRMLNCYASINLELHRRGYAMFTNSCESLYLWDRRALEPWQAIIDNMEVPAEAKLMSPRAVVRVQDPTEKSKMRGKAHVFRKVIRHGLAWIGR